MSISKTLKPALSELLEWSHIRILTPYQFNKFERARALLRLLKGILHISVPHHTMYGVTENLVCDLFEVVKILLHGDTLPSFGAFF